MYYSNKNFGSIICCHYKPEVFDLQTRLSYLTQFDVDYLKIDKSFVSKLGSNLDNDALCEAIIVMAHKLGIKVVAEGVEREDQYQKLKQTNCDYAQGCYVSKPLSLEKLQNFIKEELVKKTA